MKGGTRDEGQGMRDKGRGTREGILKVTRGGSREGQGEGILEGTRGRTREGRGKDEGRDKGGEEGMR